jgi:hypothetical protein
MDDLRELLRLTREDPTAAGRRAISRDHAAGRVHRICEGAYVSTADWGRLDDRGRHLLVAHAAVALRRRRLVFSHWTAVAVWGLPYLGSLPAVAHVVAERAAGGRTDDALVRHCIGIPRTTFIHGLEVTDLARTVVDMAKSAPFADAIVIADAALQRLASRDELVEHVGAAGSRGVARSRAVIEFADPASGSAGESLSRVSIRRAGLPDPVLQHRFEDRLGAMFVDFWWPRFNLVGEFDGAVKYDDPRFLAGRTPAQALLDEKDREDRIRALGPRVTRWRWKTAESPARIRAHLLTAGLRDERYRDW